MIDWCVGDGITDSSHRLKLTRRTGFTYIRFQIPTRMCRMSEPILRARSRCFVNVVIVEMLLLIN